jgi:ketosteroid isomerase-like protein
MEGQDIAAVVNVINLYAIGVDTRQWRLFDQVFTEDAVTDFGGPAVFSGLATIKQLFEAIHAPFDATQHATRGHHVTVSEDGATCLSYVHARFLRNVGEGGNMFESSGWYDDRLVRTEAGWRIAHRTCRTLWSGGNPAVLQTTPDVHVESVFDALHIDARKGRLGHLAAIAG